MTGLARVRTDGVSLLRRASRRPRAWVSAARDHRATVAGARRGRAAFERVALARQARRGRVARVDDWSRLLEQVRTLPSAGPPARSISIVVIAGDTSPIDPSAFGSPDVDVVFARREGRESDAAAAARACRETRGDLVCFLLPSSAALDSGWLARLAAAVDGTTVTAAAPVVLHPLRPGPRATPHDGRVRARGLSVAVEHGEPRLRSNDAGTVAVLVPGSAAVPIEGASAACVLVDRQAYTAAGALPESGDIDIAMFELGRRLRARGGNVVVVPHALIVDHRPVASRRSLHEPVAATEPSWRSYVEEHGPELLRAADPLPAGRLRIAITVSAPSAKVAHRWGDFHLAEALARALRRLGHVVRVQTLDHADDLAGRASDVHCVVRGLGAVRRTSGQVHVIWVISHPERVSDDECDDADLVLVASTRFAGELRARTRTPVEIMLQATDITRFRPLPPDPRHSHDVAVVAKSRDVFRSSVADALAAGVRPAIYGSGWESFVDRDLLVSDYVPNEELPLVYSSVGVLLNDHWDTMHTWGFVSNRVFDALACETPVISEDMPEIAELFEGTVLTYRDRAHLRELVDTTLADRAGARTRAARGRELVANRHTFDHRAEQFIDALRRHGLVS